MQQTHGSFDTQLGQYLLRRQCEIYDGMAFQLRHGDLGNLGQSADPDGIRVVLPQIREHMTQLCICRMASIGLPKVPRDTDNTTDLATTAQRMLAVMHNPCA